MMSVKNMSVEAAVAAEGMGFSPHICSYALSDLGSYYSGVSPINGLPRPDILLTTNAQCGTLTKWFEALSQELGTPMFVIDAPFPTDKRSDENSIRFVKNQMDQLVHVLEKLTGKSLQPDRLDEVLRISKETSDIWKETLLYSKTIPSPWTVFDQTIAMAPIVNCRGRSVSLEFYKKLRDEIRDRVEREVAAVPGEKHRLFIGNLPIWHDLRNFSNLFASHKVCVTVSSYIMTWSDLSVSPGDPFGDWARNLTHFDLAIDGRVDLITDVIREFALDGYVLYSNQSCKIASFGIYDIVNIVSKKTGIPGALFEADHGDPRRYSRSQVKTRLEAYFELLDQLKAGS
jgi:benzoyl-CoA reductase/2-hydroxyglutaryl-CoA dehydratase subunit BcrC/BadD/HgdB